VDVATQAAVTEPEARLGRQRDQAHVRARDHQERRLARDLRSVQRGDLGVADGEELAVALVDVVGEPAPVTLAGKRQLALDPVPVGLQHDVLVAKVQGARNPTGGGGARPFGGHYCSALE
jgi:hypothetical protein